MPDETTAVLQEIASLLRRRVEQVDEMTVRSEERLGAIDLTRKTMPDLTKLQEESQQTMAEMFAENEKRRQTEKEERIRLQEAEREFKRQLLAELDRHNSLLERLLAKLS